MNTYTVYLQNANWGAPVITADRYDSVQTELGLCVYFTAGDELVAEFIGVVGVVKRDAPIVVNVLDG